MNTITILMSLKLIVIAAEIGIFLFEILG